MRVCVYAVCVCVCVCVHVCMCVCMCVCACVCVCVCVHAMTDMQGCVSAVYLLEGKERALGQVWIIMQHQVIIFKCQILACHDMSNSIPHALSERKMWKSVCVCVCVCVCACIPKSTMSSVMEIEDLRACIHANIVMSTNVW